MIEPRTATLVHRVRRSEEDRAARRMTEGLTAETEARERLESLRRWRHEYANQQQLRVYGGSVGAGELARWRAFLGDLDRAIDAQRQIVKDCEARTGKLREDVARHRTRSLVASQLVAGAEAGARRRAAKTEQAALDEIASRLKLVGS